MLKLRRDVHNYYVIRSDKTSLFTRQILTTFLSLRFNNSFSEHDNYLPFSSLNVKIPGDSFESYRIVIAYKEKNTVVRLVLSDLVTYIYYGIGHQY